MLELLSTFLHLLTESVVQSGQDADGLDEINRHTEGAEFYGPTGTFYFLSRLQSQANSQRLRGTAQNVRGEPSNRALTGTSVVNLLHSSDYSVSGSRDGSGTRQQADKPAVSLAGHTATEMEMARECVQLYFQNLHCIHPILNRQAFLSRCETDIWSHSTAQAASPVSQTRQRFLALFNAVLAIGAITAGETSMLTWDRSIRLLDQLEGRGPNGPGSTTYPPIRAARLFFGRSKSYLGDIYESSSFETAQTLFLMAVFCQNALKPHSCYMSSLESLLWWALYSHEIEMCSSAGRQSFLREPRHYSIPLPSITTSSGPSPYLINCMVDLAEIVREISAKTYRPSEGLSLAESSGSATDLDTRLSDWKSRLPQHLDLEVQSLDEGELVTKQKIVLKLRFWNARIILHRPFLIAAATTESDRERFAVHIISCVEAARESIRFMYNTYLHRPYFRTWWYNCTYVLDSSMVLLYVVLSNIYPFSTETILRDVEKSLEIFRSMKMLAVARRCTEIIREALSIAWKLNRDRQQGQAEQAERNDSGPSYDAAVFDRLFGLMPDAGGRSEDLALFPDAPYASLVDTNLMFNFLNFEDWDAWSWQQ
ncbi:C6 transcription factor [Pleurostoma richardsiae]|uniref:C6 transcription factor n=1 Tax=Pleurostoma richardsiae TaxID=41990 RepID=A0AA38RK02_9PEZI|nr:C6 transcription factor [Pleurostoma richardsiae]